jgi:phosphatidylglycerol---prolipoprotein diacylglyceryl transferase
MTTHYPFAYDIGPLSFTGFGLAVLLGFVIAQIIASRELVRRGHDPDPMPDLVFAAVIGAMIGAKLYFVLLKGDFSMILSRGGFTFWGGLIGAIIAVTITARIKKISIHRVTDVGGIGIAAGYSVGRTGCWAVGDDYGRPWDGPLAVSFPDGAPPSTAANMRELFGIPVPEGLPPETVLAVHPTQLYETVLGFLMFYILWRFRGHKHAEGWLFGLYLVLAGVERFLIEFVRAKDDRMFGMISMAQITAIAAVTGGVLYMMWRRRIGPGRPGILAES